MKQQLHMCKYTALHMNYDAPFTLLHHSTGFISVRQYHLNCTLSDMWARYGSNKFIQMPFIIVPHVSITLVIGSPFQLCKHGLVDVSQYQKDF